jgi:pyruvate formate lyase activating enzyme
MSKFQYYDVIDSTAIVCNLCQHKCHLKSNQIGICGVNQNIDNQLSNLVYAHPVAIHIDHVEKKPLYHMLPNSKVLSFGTVGCNFKCPFCQNWDISQTNKIDSSIYVSAQDMINLVIEHKAQSIAYTYNEPTIFYPYAKDIGLLARERNIRNIFVSNGYESVEMIEDMAGWLDAINVDLKSWDDGYYKKVLKGGLSQVKDSLIAIKQNGIWLEVTTLLIDEINSSTRDIESMASFIYDELGSDTPWHLSAFYPNYKMQDSNPTKIQTLLKAKEIATKVGLKYVYLGNINQSQHTTCPHCQSVVISREYGNVVNHLHNGQCPKCSRTIEGIWR